MGGLLKEQKLGIALGVQALAILLFNGPLLSGYLAHINSDYVFMALHSEDILQGNGGAFYPGQFYGGSILAYIRAGWIATCTALGSWLNFEQILATFHYLFVPLLVSTSTYAMVVSRFGFGIAMLSSLLTVGSFGFWLEQYGNDFYAVSYCLACLILVNRQSILEMNLRSLMSFGLLAGFSLYHLRSGAIVVLVAFCPWRDLLRTCWDSLRRWQGLERFIWLAVAVLLGLFLVLDLFGEALFVWDGKPVKLHRGPNLMFAAVLLGTLYLWKTPGRKVLVRNTCAFGIAALIGFLPQILGAKGPGQATHLNDIGPTISNMVKLPQHLLVLLSGQQSSKVWIFLSVPLLAFLFLGPVLDWTRQFRQGKLRQEQIQVIAGFALCVLAYIKIRTYTTGQVRYLFPVMPFLVLMLASVFEMASRWWNGKNQILAYGLFLALGLNLISVGQHRLDLGGLERSVESERIRDVAAAAKKVEASIVECSNYWDCLVYSIPTRGRPYFVTPGGLQPALAANRYEKAAEWRRVAQCPQKKCLQVGGGVLLLK